MSDTNEHDVKISKAISVALAVAFIVFVGSIAVYNIHANVVESQNIAAEAELVRAKMELGSKQNGSIQDLIDSGTNPIAARCAIVGWRGTEQTTLCAFFVRDDNSPQD
ncbi:hypothetical protein LCGC14_1442460 [marine sediment metagenome]|uniref:Uncharacterized protein n=1 Tax=marine sediment metagenome TaxID=412755 RepID=A0A0F9JKC0_9ZZZZ